MSDDLPFRAEYAKSNRSSCKGCKATIAKDSLRLAAMIQSPMFDGKVPNWFHFMCFFGRNRVKTVGDIAHFDELRWEDQEKIKEKVVGEGKALIETQTNTNEVLKDFGAEYAKSSRSVCRHCNEKIEKGVVRISRKDYDSQRSKMYGPQDLWHHVDCFVQKRDELDFYAAASRLPGFSTLSADDQKMLLEKLPQSKAIGKRSNEEPPKISKKQKTEADEHEKKLKEQNKLMFDFRDKLQQQLNRKEWVTLLEYNDQQIPVGESKILELLSDCMAFGALKTCTECKNGQLKYRTEGYTCTGNLTEWTKCTAITKKPERKPFVIPDDMKDIYEFLKKYKFVKQERLFPLNVEPSTSSKVEHSKPSKKPSEQLPLLGMQFVISKTTSSKSSLTKKIEKLGGKVVSDIDKSVMAVISIKEEVERKSKKIKEAKAAEVHVVSEDFVEAAKNGDAISLVTQKSICDWGSDPKNKVQIPMDVVDTAVEKKKSKEETMFTKSVPSTMKVSVKGGAAVEPESGLEDKAHVLERKGSIYNAVLGLVDVVRGTNSYYKLQILEADKGNKYWLFRSWGRVGTTIGGNKLEKMETRDDAVNGFCALYEEKTGNSWKHRNEFVKHPGKFYPLEIDYGQDDDNIKRLSDLQANSKSKLPKPVQDLICLIFDVESMKKALVEFEIDLKKMPLGKLSKKQIEKAYTVLTELQELIQTNASTAKFLDASNRFYTLIPHDFGMKKPTPLDNLELIKTKVEMLESLLEIEVAYSLMKSGESDSEKDPLDVHYEKLKTEIEVVDKKSDIFKRIKDYVKNTHAATHQQYSLDVEEVFTIKRSGEAKRYKPFKQLHNRQLLWHGSRVTNFAGILSQGLRIAPPEAPVTGYMFGKGLYFADMVSKSANYCHTSKSNPTGLLLLCEVALGNMHELVQADFITKLPDGKHSTKGVGKTQPNPEKKVITDDGVEIPLGPGVSGEKKNTSLLYNEYIVYDVAQVNIKYLLKTKFNWK